MTGAATASRALAIGLAAITAFHSTSAWGEDLAVEVFRLGYVNADEVEKTAQTLLSPEGKVTVNAAANALIVVDRPEGIERVRKVLSQLDQKSANIRVEVVFVEKSRIERLNLKFQWSVAGAGWMVGAPSVPPGASAQGLTASLSSVTSASERKQSLITLENKPGKIFVGGEYPVSQAQARLEGGALHLTQTTEFKEAGSGFQVTASRAGEGKLRISIEPVSSALDRQTGAFMVKKASSFLIIDDPGTVVLSNTGGLAQGSGAQIPPELERSSSTSEFVIVISVRSEG